MRHTVYHPRDIQGDCVAQESGKPRVCPGFVPHVDRDNRWNHKADEGHHVQVVSKAQIFSC